MARKVGIYIGKNSLDLVEMDAGFQGLKVINSIRVPIPASETSEGGKNAVAGALKEAVNKAKLKNYSAIAVIPSQDALIRYFKMPLLPVKERHKAIVFEAKKYIPFKLEEVVSDYSIAEIQKKTGEEVMDLVFAAAKKDTLSDYLSYFTQAGIKIKIIEPSAISLLRWYKFNSGGEDAKSVALLELEAGNPSVNLTVVKRGIPYFVREVSLPKPLILEKQTEVNRDVLERLVSEIHISFEYYKKWFEGERVEKIVLFSQTETLSLLVELLTKEVDIPVESGARRYGIKTRGYLSSELYLATGAALRDRVKSKVNLNLYRPPKTVWFEGKKGRQKAIIVETAVAFLFLIILNFAVSWPLKFSQAQLKNVISHRPKLEANIDLNSFEALKKAKEDLIKKRNLLANLSKNRPYWTPCLNALVKLVPEGIWLSEVEFSRKTNEDLSSPQYVLSIKAEAFVGAEDSSDELSGKFLESIKKDHYFNAIFKDLSLAILKTKKIGGNQLIVFEIKSQEAGLRPAFRYR